MSDSPTEIRQLVPHTLWQHFDTICSIPHPSKHEEALAQHIMQWADQVGLEAKRDPVGNVFIKKPATAGMENRKKVVMQAHLDMVPQHNSSVVHNFATDPIKPYIDGDWVKAQGTTLGADNGIGMASCLAVLEATDIVHGPLEVLLTIDEEAGMTGANALQAGWLEAEILINTDSEQEGEIYMGCAGGINSQLTFAINKQAVPENYQGYQLQIKGLKGGHSGCDIHHGRANANKLLARFLAEFAKETRLHICEISGGNLRNAIAREGALTFVVPASQQAQIEQQFKNFQTCIATEFAQIETNLDIKLQSVPCPEFALDLASQQRFVQGIHICPHGVVKMSPDIEGVVETSNNMGMINFHEDHILVYCLTRSLRESGKQEVCEQLRSVASLAQADISFDGDYPGWIPDTQSEIMQLFRELYTQTYGAKPDIMVIHAGLECGLFKLPYPDMDMISFGPTIRNAHSPDEAVHIESVALYWSQLTALLAHIPVAA